MTLLKVEALHTEFETKSGMVKAVDGVDLCINSGEIVGIVGESGSGKSVLSKSIMRLVEDPGKITSGNISFNDESVLSMNESEMRDIRGGSIAIVPQDPTDSLNPTITVGEQIAEYVRLHQDTGESLNISAEMKRRILGTVKDTGSWQRAVEMLEKLDIPEPGNRATEYPHQFSGGMQQRAVIAGALSTEPDLLIADEPATGLDVTVQSQILDELENLKKEFDTSILLITHDLAVAAETCDRVNVMYAGEIVEKADTNELFTNPQHPYTQALLASTPRIDMETSQLEAIPGTVPELFGNQPACHFAPRCPESKEDCYEVHPNFRNVGPGNHVAACLRRGQRSGNK